ncbi:MAG: acyl carrier protein [Rhodocyclaceae bacterium]|nr:acyl carrier protein [Rhodocyclaceae bacterium]
MDVQREVLRLLDEVLSLGGRGLAMTAQSPLLGAVPELDSMAVVAILTGLEDRFGILIEDDDVDGQVFASVGSLVAFVSGKLGD